MHTKSSVTFDNHKESQMPQTSKSTDIHKGNIFWTANIESGSCGTSYSDNDLVVLKIYNASICGRIIDLYGGAKKARVKFLTLEKAVRKTMWFYQ